MCKGSLRPKVIFYRLALELTTLLCLFYIFNIISLNFHPKSGVNFYFFIIESTELFRSSLGHCYGCFSTRPLSPTFGCKGISLDIVFLCISWISNIYSLLCFYYLDWLFSQLKGLELYCGSITDFSKTFIPWRTIAYLDGSAAPVLPIVRDTLLVST